MGFIVSINSDILNHVFGKSTYVPPTEFYVGVSSTAPTAVGGGITEPSDGSYGRILTVPADWNVATTSDPASIRNNKEVVFAAATVDWFAGAEILHVVLMSALTGGTMIGTGSFSRGKSIYALDSFVIGVNKLTITLT